MNLGIFSDVHGNLPALETVLDHFRANGVERMVCLGDVASLGPQPAACLERLRAIGQPVVMGNADAFLLSPAVPHARDPVSRRIEEIELWCARRLDAGCLDFVRSFEAVHEAPLPGGLRLRCFHGTPRSWDEGMGPR